MTNCGCSYQDAYCFQGHQLAWEVYKWYAWIQGDAAWKRLSAAEKYRVLEAYEQARMAYFAHLQTQEGKEASYADYQA